MISPAEYRIENELLMQEYEQRVRNWLSETAPKELVDQIPFFRDGVACPEVWFREGNSFRPLFILKEVSLGKNSVDELPEFLKLWKNPQRFEFVENPFDDVKVGTFRQWRRIARLAKAMEAVHNGADKYNYSVYDLSFKKGGELYTGDIDGYKTAQYSPRTANASYDEIINKIAVLEIKKLGAGQVVNSKLSLATGYYIEHIEPFQDLLCRQIELLDPTVIICLGRENGTCISHLLEGVKNSTRERLWIDGYHHARSSNLHFFEEPLEAYRHYLQEQVR